MKNLFTKDCNFRNKTKCPFDRYCLKKGIYKAAIYYPKGSKEYVGSTGVSFKSRYNKHEYSLYSDKSIQTKLFKFNKPNRDGISQIK